MPRYVINAKVDQIVTKTVQLLVEGGSEEEAEDTARLALNTFPEPLVDDNVRRILVKKSHYWIPKSIEFTQIVEDKDAA